MGDMSILSDLKSRPESTAATLECVADRHIAEFRPDYQRASVTFCAVVSAQASLAQQLFGQQMVEHKAREWFAAYVRKQSPQGVGAALIELPQGHPLHAAPETIDAEGQGRSASPGHVRPADRIDPINAEGHTGRAALSLGTFADRVDPIGGDGLSRRAREPELRLPSTSDPHDDGEGHLWAARTANESLPSAVVTQKPSGGGLADGAANGHLARASTARPQSVTDIRAAGRVAKVIAKTVFDTIIMRDGRAIGDLHYSELARYRREDLRSAALLDRIEGYAQPAPGTDPVVRLLISAERLQAYAEGRNAA